MRRSILAPLTSAFVLPGLGQVINRHILKGAALMAGVTIIFLTVIVKIFLDLSAVMNEVIGPDLQLGADQYGLILEGMRNRNLTVLWVLIALGAALWAYSIFDAYIYGKQIDNLPGEDK